jgi:glycosyltransferase involved in cell wall biosynthesis
MTKQKITIGIPAFNEEANIKRLLLSLLEQSYKRTELEKIIVYSDGSTDKTIREAESIKSDKIVLIKSASRLGQANAQNRIFEKSNSEILVLLNADIAIKDKNFIEKLASPIMESENIGLTSPLVFPVKPETFFEKAIAQSHTEKNRLFKEIGSDNIYLCHGRARAFSKRLYKKFKFPKVVAEDAYSYLICNELGLKFAFVSGTKIFFRSPQNINDHIKQSSRFSKGIGELEKFFNRDLIQKSFNIPVKKYIKFLFRFFVSSPSTAVIYVIVMIYTKVFSKFSPRISPIWSVSATSKKI